MHIGAWPQTAWLPESIERDERGYVRTGGSSLETSLPGVFVVGDVRDGSLKRVAAAVGEGSTVIHQVHAYLDRVGRLTAAEA
jgi:thioredoxin reductase (NADPH)